MCGIVGGRLSATGLDMGLAAIAHRGPDGHGTFYAAEYGWALGHTLLAIQGVGAPTSGQPYAFENIVLTYNGEMWEPDHLPGAKENPALGDTPHVARLLATLGVEALPFLDGMFALAWLDLHSGDAFLARDTYGEVPLHYGITPLGAVVWASEIKALLAMGAAPRSVQWFPPGYVLRLPADPAEPWELTKWAADTSVTPRLSYSFEEDRTALARLLDDAVASRLVANRETPVAVLLSGGLDSSAIIASMLSQGYTPHAYTAVYDERSSDLKHARALARHWAIDLSEVLVPTPTAARLHDAVITAEMPHKAQVEITLACLELAAALKSDGFKVVLSGEGSDELWASYGMSYHGILKQGWGPYRRELFEGQHRKNFPRTNKVFMAAGVEARLPFLDPPLARFALRLPQDIVTGTIAGSGVTTHPKAVLAAAATQSGFLPDEHAWRTKKAFQTEARLDQAAAGAVANPQAYYRAEFTTSFRGVRP